MRADIIGPLDLDASQHGQQLLGTHLMVAGRMSARARHLLGVRRWQGKQLRQGRCPGAVQGAPDGHLHRLQVPTTRLVPSLEDHLQQLAYLLGDFLLDRGRRFFSSGVRVSSTGRSPQIFALTSTSCWLSWRKR